MTSQLLQMTIFTNFYLLALVFLFCAFRSVPAANANSQTVISSIENDLEFDENQKLVKHYVVFPANRPDCPTNAWETGEKDPGYTFTANPVDGEALTKVFPHYGTGKSYIGMDKDYKLETDEDDNRCMAACLEKGTDIQLAGYAMPHFHYAEANDTAKFSALSKWFREDCARTEVCLLNYAVRERPLGVFWINPGTGERVKNVILEYGEDGMRCIQSFPGHKLEAFDKESGYYKKIMIEHVTTISFGRNLPSSQQTFRGINKVEEKIKGILDNEWKKHQRVNRTFSSLGFAKGRLPDDVFANMAAFYYNNRHNSVSEEWTEDNLFVNWWESDVNFITIPWRTKKKWQLRLMELVSAWAGVEVEETAMYGLRQYEKGARLLSHVDRIRTHAVSLIVNVAQHNMASPWPVEVFDHGDRLHEVNMVAGDIVYYESAKNLHSRNRPLTCKRGGCRFVNLFTHYRPVKDGKDWYSNLSDVPNRPPALVEGEVAFDTQDSACKRPSNISTESKDNALGVGMVQCDDHRLGPFLSPTLFKARKADDLFQWWKATSDPNLIGFDENNEAVYQEVVYHEDDNEDEAGIFSHSQREAAQARLNQMPRYPPRQLFAADSEDDDDDNYDDEDDDDGFDDEDDHDTSTVKDEL